MVIVVQAARGKVDSDLRGTKQLAGIVPDNLVQDVLKGLRVDL